MAIQWLWPSNCCLFRLSVLRPVLRASIKRYPPVALKGVISPGRTVLLLAVRGPNALSLWSALLGPATGENRVNTENTEVIIMQMSASAWANRVLDKTKQIIQD